MECKQGGRDLEGKVLTNTVWRKHWSVWFGVSLYSKLTVNHRSADLCVLNFSLIGWKQAGNVCTLVTAFVTYMRFLAPQLTSFPDRTTHYNDIFVTWWGSRQHWGWWRNPSSSLSWPAGQPCCEDTWWADWHHPRWWPFARESPSHLDTAQPRPAPACAGS